MTLINFFKSLFTTKKDLLRRSTYSNTEQFYPKDCWAKVVRVCDGDTLVISVIIDKKIYRIKIRLDGIDTPEIHSKDKEEIKRAILAKDRLETLSLNTKNGLVYVKFSKKPEKFGRYLANVYEKDKSIKSFNQMLIEEGHAVYYNGGTKPKRLF